ncbi:MAG TPA: hypothetical protein PLZ43_12410 [bacterium]|nr:hypothetical protein [bacterium]
MERNCNFCMNCLESEDTEGSITFYTHYCAVSGERLTGGMLRECNDFTQKES